MRYKKISKPILLNNDKTNNKIMSNQDNNQQIKLPVPKHLTDKEKANLMIAWARTHNKIDEKAGTITYPSGAVGKLIPKKEYNEDLQETSTKESKIYQSKAVEVITIYTEAGVYKISDIAEDAYVKFGEISKEMFDAIKQGYASFREKVDDDTYAKLDKNTRHFSYEFFINKFKMEQSKLTTTETLGRKHIMEFLETLILNFKSKRISSYSLMGLSKAYYLLDNYKKITYEGYLRLESYERDEEENLNSYVFRIDSDEVTLSYEGYIHGPYGSDSQYEEMFNFDYDYDDFAEPELKISCWIDDFENIFDNNGSLSIDDSTENIEEKEEIDIDQDDDDAQEE